MSEQAITVRFWGVRGSFPVPGAHTTIYGGNTPCVEVRIGDRCFVLDAGTGIVGLGRQLVGQQVAEVQLLLTHVHPDHVGGLPFFKPLLTGQATVHVHCGNLGGKSAEEALDRMFSPPLFPVRLSQLRSPLVHHAFHAGETLTFGNLRVRTHLLEHPSGATAYRFDAGEASFAYVTDIEHVSGEPEPALVEFVRGCDLNVYDAMFTDEQFACCRGWGHSTWPAGVALCKAAGVGRMAAFHHNPMHDDEALAKLDGELGQAMPGSFFAREGQEIVLQG